MSDKEGLKFTLQLEHVHSLNNWWDFEAVNSIEGAYLGNIISNYDAIVYGSDPDLKTKVTYDNGDTWNYLNAPAVDSLNQTIVCDKTCSLNLFGLSTWLGVGGQGFYGNFYSDPNAIGLILATGNVGQYLLYDPSDVNTYMSRDAGQTWVELMKGSTVYEYGDHGGILVAVRNQVPITSFVYSLDEGQTWTSVNFTTSPVVVVNVFSTDITGTTAVIFGRQTINGQLQSVYFGLDFSNVHERNCDPSDYEKWTISTPCVMGRNITYLRRKATSKCFTGADFNHVYSIVNCNCTKRDYECDYGYEPTFYGSKCVKMANVPDLPVICAAGQKTYLVTQGYRKVPGDTCVNDLPDYAYIEKPCPTPSPSPISPDASNGTPVLVSNSLFIFIIIFGVVICLLICLVVGVVAGSRSSYLKEKFPWLRPRTYGYAPQIEIEEDPTHTITETTEKNES